MPQFKLSIDLSDPTVNSSILDTDIMPEPYFSETIINKNYAAFPVHLQEIDKNNSPKHNGTSKLPLSLTSRK